jgi:teichuronic acid biosynthesis glycosyltransferase TuaG
MIDGLISIIMPSYMSSKYIGAAIESVLVQDYGNWELIIVDDGSLDDTAAVAKKYVSLDSRISLLTQVNSGPAIARKFALSASRGRYIAFLDSDDIWLPGKLKLQLAFMRENNYSFSYTSYRRVNGDCSKVGHLIKAPKNLGYLDLLCNTAIATSTVIIDRKNIRDISIRNVYYDDFALWLNLLRPEDFFAWGLDMDLMRYRVVVGSVSRNKLKSILKVWSIYRDTEKISFIMSLWCLLNYVYNALLKYRNF